MNSLEQTTMPQRIIDDETDENNEECDKLLRAVKKEVKQIMEEAVTRKFVHEDSSSIISLCVAVDACLSHGLRRRVLGLFKTNSTTALIQKIAKTCEPAAEVIKLVQQQQQQQYPRTNSPTCGDASNYQTRSGHNQNQNQNQNQSSSSPLQQRKSSSNGSSSSISPLKRPNTKRYIWLKTALLERKLVSIVDHLTEHAIGPCALEFTKMKIQDHLWTDPSADELVQRHNLANPIACQCHHLNNLQQSPSSHVIQQNSAPNLTTSQLGEKNNSILDGDTLNYDENPSKKINLIGNSNDSTPLSLVQGGRKPLALSQSLKTTMVTDCHHFDCQHSNHRHHSKGYSFTSQDPTPIWSPKMLHETLHQNSKSLLLYAKNNVIMQANDMQTMPGYLSLHQTNTDLIIKWIPNQMINGGTKTTSVTSICNQDDKIDTNNENNQQTNNVDSSRCQINNTGENSEYSALRDKDLAQTSPTTKVNNEQLNNCGVSSKKSQPVSQSQSIPKAVESSYLDLVVNLSVNRIVYLHCHEREDSDEETIILVERDGTQRAPFKFPKGGLSAFLSCLESGLQPNCRLDPPLWTRYSENTIDASICIGASAQNGSKEIERQTIQQDSTFGDLLKSKLHSLRRRKPGIISSYETSQQQQQQQQQQENGMEQNHTTNNNGQQDCQQSTDQPKSGPCDYVFRIVTPLDKIQSSNCLSTPPNSANSDESSSQPSSNGQATTTSKYRGWSLSKFTQFANIAKYSSSSNNTSTRSSSMKSTSINTGESLDSVWSPSIHQPTITLANSNNIQQANGINHKEELDNHASSINPNRSVVEDATPSNSSTISNDTPTNVGENGQGQNNGSASEERENGVELPTNQSVQILCDAMRKQIISRAFYGWLSHCRHIRTVRLHLAKLVKKEIISHNNPNDANIGLTQDIWSRLHEAREGSSNELETEMFRLVYFGGIKDASLRKTVWPYLLGHYHFEDSQERRDIKDNDIKELYYSSMNDWQQIEAVVRQRDRDICAANMAKYSNELSSKQKDSEKSHTTSTLDNSRRDTNLDETILESKDEVFKEENPVVQDINSAIVSQDINNNELAGGDSTLASNDPMICEESVMEELDDDKDNNVFQDPIVVPIEKTEAIERRKLQGRLESTGSVASDASITDRFGCNIHRIDKDVQRCDRNFWYFTNTLNLDKLKNIMCSYVWHNLEVGYVQGMCDLAAPFLVIFDDEVMAYTCFSLLMKRMVANFPHGGAMDQHFASLRYLLQVLDPELFNLMQTNGDYTHFYFCYRWLLLDFKRELTYDDVYRVWETIWAASRISTDNFVLFVALAMIKYYRDIIIENNMDFTDTIKFFNEMAERHDAQRIISLAKDCVLEVQNLLNA